MASVYIRDDDYERLGRLAKLETRTYVHQLTVLLDEAFAKRGLTPESSATADTTVRTPAAK